MSRLSNEARKLAQSAGVKDTNKMLGATKSYITIGDLRTKRKQERINRSINRNK